MPLVKNTETGDNYLEKINTGADTCNRSAVRSYDRQEGIDGDGTPTNRTFSMPWLYVPDTHTMWVYVNGQKAEYKDTGGDTGTQQLEYREPDNHTITFWYPLEDDDVIEFIVAGSYNGETNDNLAQDLSRYKTTHDDGTEDGVLATHFNGDQGMNGALFTGMRPGAANGESVSYEQIGPYYDNAEVHYHVSLQDTNNTDFVLSTATGQVDVNNNKIINVADGAVADNSKEAMNGNRLYDHTVFGATASVLGHVKISLVGGVLTITTS